MTSEERNEKRRVEKRLQLAMKLRERLSTLCHNRRLELDYVPTLRQLLKADARVKRIEATLRGYD
jgi:hypothetical protein